MSSLKRAEVLRTAWTFLLQTTYFICGGQKIPYSSQTYTDQTENVGKRKKRRRLNEYPYNDMVSSVFRSRPINYWSFIINSHSTLFQFFLLELLLLERLRLFLAPICVRVRSGCWNGTADGLILFVLERLFLHYLSL